MSTYTELHNKLKESIAVSCQNRITTQAVKFHNEQNEYWGTFRGNIDLSSTVVTSAFLSNVVIADSLLCGRVRTLCGDIALDEMAGAIDELSTKLYEFPTGDIFQISNCVEALSVKTAAVSSMTINTISSEISGSLASIDEISADFKKFSADCMLSVTSEAQSRKAVDENLQSGLNDEAAKRSQIDEQLCAMIKAGGQSFKKDVAALSAEVKSISVMLSNEISSQISAAISSSNEASAFLYDQISSTSCFIEKNDISATSAFVLNEASAASAYIVDQVSAVSSEILSSLHRLSSEVSGVSSYLETNFSNDLCAISCTLSIRLTSEISSVSSEMLEQLSAVSCALSVYDISATSSYVIDQMSAVSSYILSGMSEMSVALSAALSNATSALSDEISALRIELSTTSSLVLNDLCSVSSFISTSFNNSLCATSCYLSTDISVVSAAIDTIKTVLGEVAHYKGTLLSVESSWLSDYFIASGHSKLLKGSIFHVSADQTELKADDGRTYVGVDDFIIANQKVEDTASICISSLDFIRNGFAEAEWLSVHLSSELTNQISAISCHLSTELTNQISSTSAYTIEQVSAVSSFLVNSDAELASADYQLSSVLSSVSVDCYEISTSLSSISVGLSSDLSTLSNELCSISCYLSDELCFTSCDLSTQLCATSSEVILSCNDAIRLTIQISSALDTFCKELISDASLKTLSEESELQLITKAVVMIVKALSSTIL